MSLRLRLLLGLVALVAIGLGVTDAVTYVVLESTLSSQIDQQAYNSAPEIARDLSILQSTGLKPRGGPDIPSESFGDLVSPEGSFARSFVTNPNSKPPTPSLPPGLGSGPVNGKVYLTVPASNGGGEFRLLVIGTNEPGVNLILGIPLTDVDATLNQLRAVLILVGVAVLVGMGGLAWWIVQLGLRPLARIRTTASAIAGGDLSQRVEPGPPGTEVGELATSLNEMLSQIERAFAARSASEARMRQFMSDASHELRTPLSSIRGYAELFRHGAKGRPDDLGKAMTRIESESARMSQLVDDLLLLARLDEGRPLDLVTVDVSQLAVDAVADASVADRQHPIHVDAPDPVLVLGDEARLRQVMSNLLRNATAHTPAKTPIEVSAEREGEVAVLKVADHGPGVDPVIATRIFERFVRADPSRGREQGGAGLGLAIVAAIVSAHQGTLRLDETPGGGATFTVRIPIERSIARSEGAAPSD
ncbi:MAG TPA: HAMP domain-containing sensor histidine kinase [Candidatus Nanopelagicaceae bacterium]|nr:HAMP domain-containing sensor histidine kinase [Candidatus Nanopelagicaceae bacterium]